MLMEKWKSLFLREKIMFLSGVLVILSMPLVLVSVYFMFISLAIFVITVFYNLIKLIMIANDSYSSDIGTNSKNSKGY